MACKTHGAMTASISGSLPKIDGRSWVSTERFHGGSIAVDRTVFSDLPSQRLFGWLSAFAMLAALTADLLILRSTVTFFE
jgi:hypothetical protein